MMNNKTANINFKKGYHGLAKERSHDRWYHESEILTDDTLTIEGHPVTERWETPYMKMFASTVTRHGGRILECGFGMSISATAIQRYCPTEHVIIEFNEDVFKRLQIFQQETQGKVTPILGLASKIASSLELESFDGIFYDTYPLNAEEQNTHQFIFIQQAYRLLKPGGILSYCNLTSMGVLRNNYPSWEVLFNETQVPYLIDAGVPKNDIKGFLIFNVYPPSNCQYFQHNTAIIPLIIKE